jgi:hypothetical protein
MIILYILKSLSLHSSKNGPVFVPFVSLYLLPLLRLVYHDLYAEILLVFYLLEHPVVPKVLQMPLVELQDIRDAVEPPIRLEQVGVLRQEPRVDYSAPVVLGLEVRVWKADEYLLQGLLREVLAQMPHRVRPDHRNVVEFARLLLPEPSYFLPDEIDQLVPNLHPQDQLVREQRRQPEQQSSESAADINNRDIPSAQLVISRALIQTGVFDSVARDFQVLLRRGSKFERVVSLPVHESVMRGEGKGCAAQRINMSPHSVVSFLWYQSA